MTTYTEALFFCTPHFYRLPYLPFCLIVWHYILVLSMILIQLTFLGFNLDLASGIYNTRNIKTNTKEL